MCQRADYQIAAGCVEVESARRILALHEQLASETEYAEIIDVLKSLQGYSGSCIIKEAQEVVVCIAKATVERNVDQLMHLLHRVRHVKGHADLDRVRQVLQVQAELSCEKSMPKLGMMLQQCCMLEATDSIRAAHKVLNAEAALREGESDLVRIRQHLDVCHGMFESEALDRARRALAAEQALSCSTSVSTHDVLADCAFVTGSSAVEEATRKIALFQSLQDWMPFNLIRSLASKIGQALDREDSGRKAVPLESEGDASGIPESSDQQRQLAKQRMQDLFAEFDTDNSGYIDRQEMEGAFDRMGVALNQREITNLMSMADADNTGEVDCLEFMDLIDSMLSRLDSFNTEEGEILKIRGIVQELERTTTAEERLEPVYAQAIRDAHFKMELDGFGNEKRLDVLRSFFEEYQLMLDAWQFVPEHVTERKEWLNSELSIRTLLKPPTSTAAPLVIAKRDLWESVHKCGALEGSVPLARARRILDAEKVLLFERRIDEIRNALQVCGVLHGSPAVLNARRLMDAEVALAALMEGSCCCTIHQILAAVNLCDNLEGSTILNTARSVMLCEEVLDSETRSPIIRRILSLCCCVRDSRTIDRCRMLIHSEMSISQFAVTETAKTSQPTLCHHNFDFTMTARKRESLEVARAQDLAALRRQVSKVEMPTLTLSMHVVDVDQLWEVLQICNSLTESPVLEEAACIIEALEHLPWTHDLKGMTAMRTAIVKKMGGEFMERPRMRAKLLQIFHRMDMDGSGLIDKFEIDKAFFELGVNLLPEDLDLLFEKYDTDQSGTVDADEFEEIVYDLLRGTKWINSLHSRSIRQHLEVCGRMRSGIMSDRVVTVLGWTYAEDCLLQGVTSYALLLKLVRECGALSGSAILDQSVTVLKAADEIAYATCTPTIQALVSVCGHLLDGPAHLLEQKRRLLAQERLVLLNYHQGPRHWLPCPYSLLCNMVEHCGNLEDSVSLANARKGCVCHCVFSCLLRRVLK